MVEQLKVLIVEDNDIDVLLATKLLKIANANVDFDHFENGKDAFNHLVNSNTQYDFILLDLNMPVMSGIEFLQERSNYPHISNTPVFVLSSSIDERDMLKCQSLNTAGYIEKPMDLEKAKYVLTYNNLEKVTSN